MSRIIPIKAPSTKAELEFFVANSVPEGAQLEYKDSRKIDHKNHAEIAKEVSAFANSDGGLLIFGIQESGHLPVAVDGGADHSRYTREWLENVVLSNIAPRLADLEVKQIQLSQTHSAYAVRVERSVRGPHQERQSRKYYRRFNFKAEPMEDYEIADVRGRRLTVPPLIQFDIATRHAFSVYFVIRNAGQAIARDVTLQFSPQPTWLDGPPPLIRNGIRYFPPGREFKVRYHSFPALFGKDSKLVSTFDVAVTYLHDGTGDSVREELHVDLGDYLETSPPEDEVVKEFKELRRDLESVRSELHALSETVCKISSVAGATGLDLSVTTIRELAALLGGDAPIRRIPPRGCSPAVFAEMLGVNDDLAERLSGHFWGTSSMAGLQGVAGVEDELLEKIRKNFRVENA